jgi:hypothetical protein
VTARAKIKFVRGKWQKVEPKTEATPTLEHRVDRLFTVAHNFNDRFVAIEQALAALTNSAPAPKKRTRRSQPSADIIG